MICTNICTDKDGHIIEDEIKFFTLYGKEVAFGFFHNDAKGLRDFERLQCLYDLILDNTSEGGKWALYHHICNEWKKMPTSCLTEEEASEFVKLADKHQVRGVMRGDMNTVDEFVEFAFERYYEIEHAKLEQAVKDAERAVKIHEMKFKHFQSRIIPTRNN